ncbi:MAG: hypothetical protein DRR11_16705 [Gammaproteobacteria bacterium]|nr:MAG: hypothetical protein DRR11_16705 [Gammaproteobacteria bacterium]
MKNMRSIRLAVGGVAALAFSVIGVQAHAQDYSDHRAVLAYAETITDPLSGEAGKIEIFRQDKGNGQLNHDFAYNDPRRAIFNGGDPGVNFAVHPSNGSADTNLTNQGFWNTESVDIWNREACSNMEISQTGSSGNPGVVELYFQTGQIFAIWEADLTQVGFLSAAQFPYFAANPNVLGVTFTLTWVDGAGNPTDIDGNGKADVAFREIYYNDEYEWADNGLEGTQPSGVRLFDFPTVAIHEVGHGVTAAHFGLIGVQDGNLVAHPRSIMNAIYGGTLRELHGRDRGANCSNWAQWPNR